jgi:hypothetical protein
VDTRIVQEVRDGTASGSGVLGVGKGIIDSPDDVGGYPIYIGTDPPVDSDHDGMPDAWEIARGLNPNNPDDRNLRMESGYTALEVYLNELVGEIIEFKLSTAIPEVQTLNWSIFRTPNELNVSDGVIVDRIRVSNLFGQILINKKNVSKISIANLSQGIYLAEVITQNQGDKILKFTK